MYVRYVMCVYLEPITETMYQYFQQERAAHLYCRHSFCLLIKQLIKWFDQ